LQRQEQHQSGGCQVTATQELPAGISHVTMQPLLDLPGTPLKLQYFNLTPQGFGKPIRGRLMGIIRPRGGVLLNRLASLFPLLVLILWLIVLFTMPPQAPLSE
jgi:hypothetical protein